MEKIRGGVRFVLRYFLLACLVVVFWPSLLMQWVFDEEFRENDMYPLLATGLNITWVAFGLMVIILQVV